MSDVTLILDALEKGEDRAVDRLLPAVYQELRQLAIHKLAAERPGYTLQATALVHEAYLRLVGSANQGFQSRTYFFGAAAEAMRRILIENARRSIPSGKNSAVGHLIARAVFRRASGLRLDRGLMRRRWTRCC